jgi:hypothetical protein
MSADDGDNTVLTLALAGAGAFLLWRLWPRGGAGGGSGDGGADAHGADAQDRARKAPVVVRLSDGDRIELDGKPSDLATTIAHARIAGAARVVVTGDARHGWAMTVLDALEGAGVEVSRQVGTGYTGAAKGHTSLSAFGSLRNTRALVARLRNASPFSLSQSCPSRDNAGGALVRASYRVPPFLADDVLLVMKTEANTNGRVYCVAYDVTWGERQPERSGWLDRDTLTPILQPGMRVELSPTCALWGSGAKHGTIRDVTKDWTVVVKMDDRRVRKLQRFRDHTQLTLREPPPNAA